MEPVTIQRWLSEQSQAILLRHITNSDLRVLLASELGVSREWLITHQDEKLTVDQLARLGKTVTNLNAGVPLPYITGTQEFYGLSFVVTPEVLIPRPETEQLVELAIQWLKDHPQIKNTMDIGTGSGCIAVSLAKHLSNIHVTAVDTSAAALRIALKNAENYQVLDRIKFIESSLTEWLKVKDSYLVCANLPYIPSSDLNHLPVAYTEPVTALDGGSDGLDLIRMLLEQLQTRLVTPYCILLEIEYRQGESVSELASRKFPQASVTVFKDFAGLDRIARICG